MATRDSSSFGPLPLYRRIYNDLKAQIESGEYQADDRLPSELELSRSYNVSRITSRQALDLLSTEGLLIRRQGMGSFVASNRVSQPLVRLTDFVEDMSQAGLQAESQVLRWETEPATPHLASLLGLEKDVSVFRLDRLRLANGSPIALDWTWLPPQFGKLLDGEDLTSRTIYRILEGEYGIPIVSGEYAIEACVGDAEQAELLGMGEGDPLLLFGRTSFTTGHKAVYHQKRFYRADRLQYRLTLARTSPGESKIDSFTPVFADRSVPD
ncbi:MAG: GntR family transcriptional regulator [Chloroflexota bacterium]